MVSRRAATQNRKPERFTLFARAYCQTRNGTQAALEAGYEPKSATSQAGRLLRKSHVLALIAELDRDAQERAEMNRDDIALMWKRAALTDRNDLVEVRRHCCRYCYGFEHRYQETPEERRRREDEYASLQLQTPTVEWPPFKELGGVGYNRRKNADPDCPECFGDGEMTVIIKDTRRMPPAARAIYEGAKFTKDGIEIKIMDRTTAIVNMSKILGIAPDRIDARVAVMDLTPEKIPDEPIEAAKIYARMIAG